MSRTQPWKLSKYFRYTQYATKLHHHLGRYMIWTRAACEAAYNNSSGPWQRKGRGKKLDASTVVDLYLQ